MALVHDGIETTYPDQLINFINRIFTPDRPFAPARRARAQMENAERQGQFYRAGKP
jgi:hypothetical protein